MRYYCDAWNGPVSCILQSHNAPFPFGRSFNRTELPFDVQLLSENGSIKESYITEFDIIMSSGDNHKYLNIAEMCANKPTKLVYNVEYTPETRRQIALLDRERILPRKIYSLLWIQNQERRRRRAFKLADGIQASGYAAMDVYSSLNNNTVLYLDNRLSQSLLATDLEMSSRHDRIRAGKPIRLLNSGRLETMKGAQDLVPIAKRLKDNNVDFTLDIFGTGSLADEIKKEIEDSNLQDRVCLHEPVDFETQLVPFARTKADIFLSCNRQSDPSCTYIESMGCGLPIAGYSNKMWEGMLNESGGGWAVPLGDWRALADRISQIAKKPEEIVSVAGNALSFASDHHFESEFKRRIEHLKLTSKSSNGGFSRP